MDMAALHGGAISPEIKLYCAIWWLAGASYLDVQYKVGISKPSFHRIVWATKHVINHCDNLAIKFPSMREECLELAEGFHPLNEKGALKGCIGALDGWLPKIFTPLNNAVGNVSSFFSGHYQCYGLNVQAICDHHCHFLYIAILGPGIMNDNQAYKVKVGGISLSDLIERLPRGFYVVANAAYSPTEHVIPCVGGVDACKPKYDTINFVVSQCHIRIEMAFGLLCKKWGIFWRPCNMKFEHYKEMIGAAACLHNFLCK